MKLKICFEIFLHMTFCFRQYQNVLMILFRSGLFLYSITLTYLIHSIC